MLGVFVLFIAINDSALAEISVDPTRIVLTQNNQTAQITVRNDGLRAQRITPVWRQLIQASDASLHPAGNEISLADMPAVRVWPSSVLVEPRSSQTFSLLVPPTNKFIGETRIHLRLNIDPARGTGPRWAVVIPIFVRDKQLNPEVAITRLGLTKDGNLSVTMLNTANISPHGHLVVFDRDGLRLATLNNVNLYKVNAPVTFSIDLPLIPLDNLLVRYLGDAEFSGQAFAEQKLQISPDLSR